MALDFETDGTPPRRQPESSLRGPSMHAAAASSLLRPSLEMQTQVGMQNALGRGQWAVGTIMQIG
jgi:hypothetical protein